MFSNFKITLILSGAISENYSTRIKYNIKCLARPIRATCYHDPEPQTTTILMFKLITNR